MKTLVVNNYLEPARVKADTEAVELFSEYEVIKYHDVPPAFDVGGDIDAVLLTGSEARIVKDKDVALYRNVLNFIGHVEIPVIGVCFGHQLLCLAMGAEVGVLSNPVINRFEYVHVIKTDWLFEGFEPRKPIPVAEFHNDYVKKESLPKAGLDLLAYSTSCETEAVRHKDKPLFGIQFHAERIRIKEEEHPEGHKIIGNFFRQVEVHKNA